ncbi:hypothetical protein [Micromonospora sp. NPDC023956]|uniref:hypothetical protein n=1 Tax=Micromonospora sp. NPDC023956 TaxID=3155722 RepID=UPI0033F328DA
MSNPNKAKGNRWELALRKLFRAATIRAFKPYQEGHEDAGDIQGLSPFVGQAKDWARWEDAIRVGLDGAERQKVKAREAYGVAFVKRARSSTGYGYAVTTVVTFVRALLRLRRAEALLREHAPEAYAEHMAAVRVELGTDYDSLAKLQKD